MSKTASAVFVMTSEEIASSGARNIPDLLRMVPGVEVAQINSNKWAISIRGSNGQYSNQLLVLVDGRTVHTPMLSGVFWDAQDVLPEEVDELEVIRGRGPRGGEPTLSLGYSISSPRTRTRLRRGFKSSF